MYLKSIDLYVLVISLFYIYHNWIQLPGKNSINFQYCDTEWAWLMKRKKKIKKMGGPKNKYTEFSKPSYNYE